MHPIGKIIVERNCIGTDHIIKGRPTWKRETRQVKQEGVFVADSIAKSRTESHFEKCLSHSRA